MTAGVDKEKSRKTRRDSHMPTKYDKWTCKESDKMLAYLCQPENLRVFLYNKNYCYNQISEHILRERSAGQIKNKLASLENRYNKARRQLSAWMDAHETTPDALTADQLQFAYEDCFDPPVPEYPQLDTVFSAKPTRLRVSLLNFAPPEVQSAVGAASVAMQSNKRKIDGAADDGSSHLGLPPQGFNPNIRRRTESDIDHPARRKSASPSSGRISPQQPAVPPSVSMETTVNIEQSPHARFGTPYHIAAHQPNALAQQFQGGPLPDAPPSSLHPGMHCAGEIRRNSIAAIAHNNSALLHSPHISSGMPSPGGGRSSIAAIAHNSALLHSPHIPNGMPSPGGGMHMAGVQQEAMPPIHRLSVASTESSVQTAGTPTLADSGFAFPSGRALTAEEIALRDRELALREREQQHRHQMEAMRQQQEIDLSRANLDLRRRELELREREAAIAGRRLGLGFPPPSNSAAGAQTGAPADCQAGRRPSSPAVFQRDGLHAQLQSYRISSNPLPQINVSAADKGPTPRDLLQLPSDDLLKYKSGASSDEQSDTDCKSARHAGAASSGQGAAHVPAYDRPAYVAGPASHSNQSSSSMTSANTLVGCGSGDAAEGAHGQGAGASPKHGRPAELLYHRHYEVAPVAAGYNAANASFIRSSLTTDSTCPRITKAPSIQHK